MAIPLETLQSISAGSAAPSTHHQPTRVFDMGSATTATTGPDDYQNQFEERSPIVFNANLQLCIFLFFKQNSIVRRKINDQTIKKSLQEIDNDIQNVSVNTRTPPLTQNGPNAATGMLMAFWASRGGEGVAESPCCPHQKMVMPEIEFGVLG